ncbi:hypothetical protein [Mycolicibacterium sp.]|uniref:hypothetical protein n=1 Tax=Mycolicibacterium sp. TaxID=2320850 RepID=UPI00355CF6F7
MSKIGISPDEARHLVGQQSSNTDEVRAHMRTIDNLINSLASATYVSETTNALRTKWETETKPQFEKVINRAETAQAGTNSAVDHQLATQGSHAGAISAI